MLYIFLNNHDYHDDNHHFLIMNHNDTHLI